MTGFHREILVLDAAREAEAIAGRVRTIVANDLRKRGAVIAISGGIDSAVCAALCVKALGPERVFGLLLPERASAPESAELGKELAATFDIATLTIDISPILEAAGCYQAQDEAIRAVVPDYGPGWKHKVVLPSILGGDRLNLTRLVVETPEGVQSTHRIPVQAYLQLIAATNFKQRTRKMTEYFHADRLNYAVCGTPNRLEYDQGFFVKLGDGSADFKPIAHLYKTQIYALGRHLGVPEKILRRLPTTDTFTIPQTQEEFYYALPYELMDLCLFACNHDVPPEEAAVVLNIEPDQVRRIYKDIDAKRMSTRALHLPPLLAGSVPEIERLLASPSDIRSASDR